MVPRAREQRLLSTAGANGAPGTNSYGARSSTAYQGQHGVNGRSASASTRGRPGSDIRVRVSYSPDSPGIIQVTGEGAQMGQRWELQHTQDILLEAKGGNGGAGGRGEDGQHGGEGWAGVDATQYSDATCGTAGLAGGDGGYGTSGAEGADAGNVYIDLHEGDLDCLVGVSYDIEGGEGGASGTHGRPGNGGPGGPGGRGCTWTEQYSHTITGNNGQTYTEYSNRTFTRPGAPPGPYGVAGRPPNGYLSGGRGGRNGHCQIRVMRSDLTEGTYPSRYAIKVVGFDVVDENEDGVNEPGEYLFVRNIRITNVGGMPSPRDGFKILIQGTDWLEPVTSEPLVMPREIQPGAIVTIPGQLRALIRQETKSRPVGSMLKANDFIALVAYSERLNRVLPEFGGAIPICFQYPIELCQPNYLDAIAKGDRARFTWTLRNISSKTYGVDSSYGRRLGTRFSDPNSIFDIKYGETPHVADDMVPLLYPGAEIPVEQEFVVSDDVPFFTTGKLNLDLLLQDPQSGALKRIASYEMSVQVSSSYQFDPLSQFLLVVNASTPNNSIHQMIAFVEQNLNLRLDIFNLSLSGSFKNPETNHNVLYNYENKTIIIFGNTINFFSNGKREPWDLIDPWEACLCARRGVNLLFTDVENGDSLQNWTNQAIFPAWAFTDSRDAPATNTFKLVLNSLSSKKTTLETKFATNRFIVKKSLMSSLDKKLEKQAYQAVKQLDRRLPMQRFLVTAQVYAPNISPNAKKVPKPKTGAVIIAEGLPRSATLMCSQFPISDVMTDYHAFTVLATIPFRQQVQMFWNIIAHWGEEGVPSHQVFDGQCLTGFKPRVTGSNVMISSSFCHAIILSVQFHLLTECTRFNTNAPWPDPIPSRSVVSHLPRISTFLAAIPKHAILSSAETSAAKHLVDLFSTLMGSLAPGAMSMGTRRAHLHSTLQTALKPLLSKLCADPSSFQKAINKHTKKAKKDIRALAKSTPGKTPGSKFKPAEAGRLLVESERLRPFLFPNQPDAKLGFVDLNDFIGPSEVFLGTALDRHRDEYARMKNRADADADLARRMRSELIISEGNETLPGPVISPQPSPSPSPAPLLESPMTPKSPPTPALSTANAASLIHSPDSVSPTHHPVVSDYMHVKTPLAVTGEVGGVFEGPGQQVWRPSELSV